MAPVRPPLGGSAARLMTTLLYQSHPRQGNPLRAADDL